MADQDSLDVDLVRCRAGKEFESFDGFHGAGPAMWLHHGDHHFGASFQPAMAFLEHGEGLAYARRVAEIDT